MLVLPFNKIAIIILHYGDIANTLICLSSVLKIEDTSFEVILVDNGTKEEALQGIASSDPRIHLLRSEMNRGFSAGCNLGIRFALERAAQYFFLLNNDTIVAPSVLQAFRQAVQQFPEAGVFGAKIYFFSDPERIWYAGGDVNARTLRCHHTGCGDLDANWQVPRPTSYACGCALFTKREVLERAGLFDEAFFLNWEEIDWCYRMRAKGYSCMFIPEAKVWHRISSSFIGGHGGPLWQYHYSRSRILFIKRHLSRMKRFRFYLSRLLCECLVLLLQPFQATRRASLQGIWHGFIGK